MQIKNVLIFPCGTEIGQEVHAALKHEKSVNLFGASSTDDHGRMVFNEYFPNIPYINEDSFNIKFEECLKAGNIDFVIPAHDSVLLYLAENKEKFSATIMAPEASICRICRSKKATYQALTGEDFVPIFYNSISSIPQFPVFLKPDIGQGSQGIVLAKNPRQAEEALHNDPGLIICEYLPGKEYTVDCYSDKTGKILFSGARERLRTKAGISVNSKAFHHNDAISNLTRRIADRISKRLQMTGVWFFQLKEASDGTLKLLEIAPRVAGTMALHRIQGVNFPLLALFEEEGKPVSCLPQHFEAEIERALTNRYIVSLSYKYLYLDLDDTMIVHNKLNLTIMQLIYQCNEKEIPIKLITRHYRDPRITLNEFKLHENLFDEIIWITDKSAPKSKFITKEDALFIDDSYRERLDVFNTSGIATLSPDGAEALLDWRK